ncbi:MULTISPECIES: hypothetical protein [Cetobacterium]|jgi:hypothetical protein|uniref:Uncharacterized protein n=1 Tax=Candidatus Cetobacterium colombiensis TaxID=3073100 RepID=A0ABU4W7V0_9FUSO|nr:hypothetical protein [Candidatus Cetobacterium colombiensis]MDX8335606.1 hypothetical protein [Candidatus Cetobacterium colombiensis]
MTEELMKKIDRINEEFEKREFFIKEDILELFEQREDLREKLDAIKFKKIEFFNVEEENCVGFTLDDVQVNFFIEFGEDEEGEWYEATAEIISF